MDKKDALSQAVHDAAATSLRGALADVKIIATGGMSLIFRARQPTLDRYIVVKKLKEELLTNPETLERFRREAKALASILHQNVAHVYDFVESGHESYILMEYIDGIDVSQLVEKVGHLPPNVAAAILLGVAKGVGYLHAHHLIHRDIKPSNVRLTTHGEVKLMDFGIVMDIDNQGLTRPGMMVGSPSYLSPEQVLGDPISPQADIFLLGIFLYEMLTGTRPFKDEGRETVFQRIREAKYVPVKDMQSQAPGALDRIVRKCLQKDPNKRYANIKQLIAELERYLGPTKSSHTEDLILTYLDEEALLAPAVPYAKVEEPPQGFGTKALWIVVGICAVTALLTGLVGYQLGRRAVSDPGSPAAPAFPAPKPLKSNK